MGRLIQLLVLLALPATGFAAGPWSEVEEPNAGSTLVLGSYAAGCVSGAAELPLDGEGYQVMRPSRNRYYGHPQLVALVQDLGREANARGWGEVLIGDLSQPRGGPMAYGHQSHQSGLDADVWLQLTKRPLSLRQREDRPMRSVVNTASGKVDPRYWSKPLEQLLRLAATRPEVERIFVNPVIKQHLCKNASNRPWLGKLRPWWGHDAHFHVRLACPPGSPDCKSQAPIPSGDGCDADLGNWVRDVLRAAKSKPPAKKSTAPRREPELPTECSGVLAARGVSSTFAKLSR